MAITGAAAFYAESAAVRLCGAGFMPGICRRKSAVYRRLGIAGRTAAKVFSRSVMAALLQPDAGTAHRLFGGSNLVLMAA